MPDKRPNFLLIVADGKLIFLFGLIVQAEAWSSVRNIDRAKSRTVDLGYSDLSCYGSEIKTRNIDRLAREGVQFTDCQSDTLTARADI